MAKFIVFEGTDCSGKTTSVNMLIDHLNSVNIRNVYIKFPDRSGVHGEKIDKYLKREIDMTEDEAYQMFVENREPYKEIIENYLKMNITVICDRYLYSGIVYSTFNLQEKLNDKFVHLSLANEYYMPTPDLLFLINGYHPRIGDRERYETPDIITVVFFLFNELFNMLNVKFKIIDNNGSIDDTKQQMINHYNELK